MTLGARVLLLPHVSFYMSPQGFSPGKSLFTLRAGEGLFSCMDSTVCVQVTGLGEGLVTGGAGEGLISRVCPLMPLQVTRLGEGLVTLGTGMRFLFRVDSHVDP